MLTRESLAASLDGREYRNEINYDEGRLARQAGLLVLFGCSDDLLEACGAIEDEYGCYDGGTFHLLAARLVDAETKHKCNCEFCGLKEIKDAPRIIVERDSGGYSWLIEAEGIEFSPFTIKAGVVKFCRGIVIDMKELRGAAQ